MGRRSSGARTSSPSGGSRGGLFGSRSAPAPAPRSAAAPPATQQSSGGGGFLGSVMHGMASGVGFSMASRAVDSVVGPRTVEVRHTGETGASSQQPAQQQSSFQQQETSSQSSCQFQQDQVNQCLSQASDMSCCKNFFDSLKQCQQETARL